MVNIYNKDLKFIIGLNYEYEEFIKNPNKYYSSWDPTYYATEQRYEAPILIEGILREKSREEKILLDNRIELLTDGEYIDQGQIIDIPCPEGFLKSKWDIVTHTWSEGATDEELKEFYFNLINKYKAEILEVGFDFNKHQQKCREKDLTLLGNAIAANEDAVTFSVVPVTHWSFNDNDVVEMSLNELKRLRIAGATFVQAIFKIEAILKSSKPNILFTKEEFIQKIDETSIVKCFK